MSTSSALLGSLALTLVLAGLHMVAPLFRRLPGVSERAAGSFAGGLAVAYVFLHLLPELAAGNAAIGQALRTVVDPTPLFDLAVFAVALAGFALFYGLERLAGRTGARTGTEPNAGVYRLHLAAFLGYNFVATYTMPLRVRTGVDFAILFTVAIGLHFILTDRGLTEKYPHRFPATGRYVLVTALLLGWGVSAITAPANVLLVSLLTALLSGSVLLNVFQNEIPDQRRSSFLWFCIGLILYGVLLTLVTAAG